MTSISTATQVYTPQATSHAHSGKNRMASAIQQQEASGALSGADATALTNALSAIDSSLSANATSGTSAASGSPDSASKSGLDPSSMKDRINSLISDQVSSGTLTSGQATELKNLFASHGTSVTSADSDGDGGGPDGPPPAGPPPGLDSGSSSANGTFSVSSASGTSSSDLLATFIQQLQSSQSTGSGYSATGSTGSSQSAALLFDFKS